MKDLPVLHINVTDPFTVLSATAKFLDAIGLDANDVIGKPLSEVFPETAFARLQDGIGKQRASAAKVRLRDVECIEPGILPLDIELSSAASEQSAILQLRLIETVRTRQAVRSLVASLFEPTSARSPSFVWVSDVGADRIRAIHNNLTHNFGLGNCFTFDEFRAASHPEDIKRDTSYLEQRLGLSDHDYITFDQRMRTVTGQWCLVASRSRVLTRDRDGRPRKMLGVIFDASEYHSVNFALEEANVALSRAEKNEREHLGRDLHDALSQILVGAKLAAQSLNPDQLTGPGASARIRELDSLITSALEEIRAFSFLLHPPDLDDFGLAEAIAQLCKGLAWRFGIPISFTADPALSRQPAAVEFALFRVAQEALMNVHRHAGANLACVMLRKTDGVLELEVRDNGIGLPSIDGDTLLQEGVGLSGMRTRIDQIGGQLSFEDARPGLRVLATVGLAPDPF